MEDRSKKEIKRLETLKNRRAISCKQMDRVAEFLDAIGTDITLPQVELRTTALDDSFHTFEKLQSGIEELDPQEIDDEVDTRAKYEELYYKIRPQLTSIKQTFKAKDESKEVPLKANPENIRLPKINLPSFSGEVTEWLNFFDSFNSLIHSNLTLSNIAKFQYLKSSISGSAARAIESLEVNDKNYDDALKILISRYENKRLICSEHIRKLFDVTSIQKPSAAALRELADCINSNLRALGSLGRPVEAWDDVIVHLISSKLDSTTRNKWQEEHPVDELPTLKDFMKFIDKRCQIMDCTGNTSTQASTNSFNPVVRKLRPKAFTLTNHKVQCSYCSRVGHSIGKCYKFVNLPVTKRQSFVQEAKLCCNCLHDDHSVKDCKASTCHKCSASHHTLLHSGHTSTQLNASAADFHSEKGFRNVLQVTEANKFNHVYNPNLSNGIFTFLATAVVLVNDKNNDYIPCRILLDSGSQINLITDRFAHMLGSQRIRSTTNISTIGSNKSTSKFKTNLSIKSRFNEFTFNIEATIITKITNLIPERSIDVTKWPIPSNIKLADPLFATAQRIDILIGASHFFSMLSVGQIQLKNGLPTLQNTVLGWVVSGVVSEAKAIQLACNFCNSDDENIEKLIQTFSRVENILDEMTDTKHERECEYLFRSTYERLPSGRYQVRLPFKRDIAELGDSYQTALRRFLSLERRIHRDPNVATEYITFMREYATLSHMQAADNIEFDKPHYFLPHHCVIKPESSTTKLRVVFDASAKTTTGQSLNDIMYVGPILQADLFTIAIKFRYHKYVFTADITKMYRQIRLHDEDTRFQYIIWRESPADNVKVYKLLTVTYGTSPASFLTARILHQLADDEYSKYPLGAEVLKSDFYVDDVLSGANNLKEVRQIKQELELILQSGGFQLRKWCANNEQIISDVESEDRESFFHLNNNDVVKTLGLIWEPNKDTFQIKITVNDTNRITKRTVLSDISRLFDPLGLVNPVIVGAKLFMQTLWKAKLHWDEALPQDLQYSWNLFRAELPLLEGITIERHVLHGDIKNAELHGFADSSEKAYGACIYVRSVADNGKVSTRLLCSKSKVAPVDKNRLTLPRLELCAAVMLARLVEKVRSATSLEFSRYCYWTDSSIVLCWISSQTHQWSTFIGNRVAVIQRLSGPEQWHHVDSKNNPADILSRGATPTELKGSPNWFHGPSFLQLQGDNWPTHIIDFNISDEILERKRKKDVVMMVLEEDEIFATIKFQNNYRKLVRTIAFVLRFIYNLRSGKGSNKKRINELDAGEIEAAKMTIIKFTQRKAFSKEIGLLKKNVQVNSRSHICSLSPFIDTDGILRVGGRLKHAQIPYDFKHPILLPKDSSFTRSLMVHYHQKHHHLGAQGLLSIIRRQFWPVHGKMLAKKVVRECVLCFRSNPKTTHPIMADLPYNRVHPSRPFEAVGTDFCGPFLVHFKGRGSIPAKVYVAIFICLSTKAVHLEIVSDLSTAACMGALRRFFSRRGLSRIIYSDNGTNYVGAKNELTELYKFFNSQAFKDTVMEGYGEDGIEWRTIPPRSPHFGGIWEAAVKSAKHHMKRLLHLASLTFEELNTLVIQVEAILNSRPISPLSEDPSDPQPLTPGHFLVGSPLLTLPDHDLTDRKLTYLSRWQRVQWLMQQFWHRWSNDYLHCLQERGKWRKLAKELQPNDVVIIKDEHVPPLKWKFGRIIQLHPGHDGVARVADIQTAKGKTSRAIAKLCVLPKVEEANVLQGGEYVRAE